MNADTMRCRQCGGVIAVAGLADNTSCPYCRAEFRLSAEELAQLAAYREHVRAQLQRSEQERAHADAWNYWYGGAAAQQRNRRLNVLLLYLGLGLPVAGIGFGARLLLPTESSAQVISTATPLVMVLGYAGYLLWYYTGRSRRSAPAAVRAAPVACPSCGAPHELLPGEVLTHCRYCQAPIIPGTQAIAYGRAAADRAFFEAEMARARAERQGFAELAKASWASKVPYLVLGSFALMTTLGASAFTVSFALGREHGTSLTELVPLWGVAFANWLAIAAVVAYRQVRRERLERAAAALARELGGTPLADVRAMNAWFDRHWAGGVPAQQLLPGPYFVAVASWLAGHAALLVMNPSGASEGYPAFFSVRISAWLPEHERFVAHPALARARDALARFGFALELTRTGLVGIALERSARSALSFSDPRPLCAAFVQLAHAVRELGGAPIAMSRGP